MCADNQPFDLTDEEYDSPQYDIEQKKTEGNTKYKCGGSNSNGTDDGKEKKKSKKKIRDYSKHISSKRSVTSYKYSKGKGLLHEAVIVAEQTAFLKYEDGEPRLVQNIEESRRIVKPPDYEEYAYQPYEFKDKEDVQSNFERAKKETIGSLYDKAKLIVEKYNDQDQNIIILLAADIVGSYFQDIFPTTHYINIVGENDTGKSSLGYTFEYTGYRPIRGTGISAANYYRTLGTEEPGQCTIIEDEGDNIDQDPEKMGILKSGYELMAKVPKINMNSFDQKPRWYYAYCFKIIIAEKSLDQHKAKGLADRTLTFHCRPGRTKQRYSIKEIVNYRNNNVNNNNNNNPLRQQLHNELVDFRKLMLSYRLLHYEDPLVDIQTGLRNRDVELCGPLLQLFYGLEQAISEVISALGKFLEEKKEKKVFGLEASLYPLIINLVSRHGYEPAVSQIWSEIIHNIEGSYDDEKPSQFQTNEFGILYKNTITKIIVDKFGSGRKKKNSGNAIVFSKEKLQRFAEAYSTRVNIRISLGEDRNGDSGSSGGILDYFSDNHLSNSAKNDDNSNSAQKTNASNVINSDTGLTSTALPAQVKNNQKVDLHLPEPPQHPQLPPALTEDSSSNIGIISNSSISNRRSIYRIGHTDNWACKKCTLRGDKFFMRQHICRSKTK
jgi:hypothetical protein